MMATPPPVPLQSTPQPSTEAAPPRAVEAATLNRSNDVAVGLVAGTAGLILFKGESRRTSTAVLTAMGAGGLWHRLWAPTRRRSYELHLRINQSSLTEQILLITKFFREITPHALDTPLRGSLIWAVAFASQSPPSRSQIQVRTKVALLMQADTTIQSSQV